ncbi:AMP-dependent synthetase/ligase [Thauera butanivorans]|uniref:AMP-dependent synthetase/ligase n=1 Tax=Thauera butanivorans TaxID=86174 RepID=UPI000837CBD4|nr:AMP-binding protein [Thauera butanivorans]
MQRTSTNFEAQVSNPGTTQHHRQPDGAISAPDGARTQLRQVQTLPALLDARAGSNPSAIGYVHRTGSASTTFTWADIQARVHALQGGFLHLGIGRGDRVAVMLPTTPEWELVHLAILGLGAAIIGLDAHDTSRNLEHILAIARPRIVIAADAAQLDRLDALYPGFSIRVIAAPDAPPGTHALGPLHASLPAPAPAPPLPTDIATVIFTSGSTGEPKGIAYTHAQILLACRVTCDGFPSIGVGDRMVCWLPPSSMFQRVLNLCAILFGAETHFVERPEQIVQRLPEIQPSLFVAVPRFFEKLHAGMLDRIDAQPAPIRVGLRAAWSIEERIAKAHSLGTETPLHLRLLHPFTKRALTPLRRVMGSKLRFLVSGSAPLPIWLIERFGALGWPILEAYGVSENIVPIAFNTLEASRPGSVGRPHPSNEVRIAEDGELLVRGPGVCSRYEPCTQAVSLKMSKDGFLHTGDYARLDEDGYLWLLGRKSEIFKTSTGRRVTPHPVEAEIKRLEYVEHAIVTGEGHPFPVVIVTLAQGKPNGDGAPSAPPPEQIAGNIQTACAPLPSHQRPAAVIVTSTPLSIENGELTANLKLRRKVVELRFADSIEEAYRRIEATPDHGPGSAPIVVIAP